MARVLLQWDNCSLSNRPLESSRVLCCPLGFLFNAEALLTVLLKGEALPEKYTHIKSKKVRVLPPELCCAPSQSTRVTAASASRAGCVRGDSDGESRG